MNKIGILAIGYLVTIWIAVLGITIAITNRDTYLLGVSNSIILWLLEFQSIISLVVLAKLDNSIKNGRFQNN